jgi:protein TonB
MAHFPQSAPRNRLAAALALSLLLHALLLAASALHWPADKAPAPPLEVRLIPAAAEAPAEGPLLKDTIAQAETPAEAAPPPPPPVPAKSPIAAAKPRPVTEIAQRKLAEHLYYPAEAIKAGLEGEVRLLLTLDASGAVQEADIAASSGHPILDQAALRAAYAMGRVDAGGKREMILPVTFRLR